MTTKIKQEELNLLNDYMFKAIFRSEEAREMVAIFLSKITNIEKEKLEEAEYQGGELIKKNKKEKGKVSDIIIKLEDNNRIILEMNQYENKYIVEKNSSYAFSLYSELIPIRSKKYPKIYLINIDNYNKYKTKEGILHFKLRDEYGNIETDRYESIHLIIENIIKEEYNEDEDIKKTIELLKERKIEEMKKKYEGDEIYMAAVRRVEELSTDPNFIGYYDKEEAIKQDLIDMRETGYDEGLETGLERGLEKGTINTQAMAIKNMLKKGFDVNTISEILNISISDIEKYNK